VKIVGAILILGVLVGCVIIIGNNNTVVEAPKGLKDPTIQPTFIKTDSIP